MSVDITRDNFWAMLPLVKEALERCTFFAFDLEMTGLFLADNRHQYLDDFEERWVCRGGGGGTRGGSQVCVGVGGTETGLQELRNAVVRQGQGP